MNINTNISNDDPGRPAAFTNTVYESLKANPQRTKQVLQQGPNAGLAWLGAAAADRYQQHAMNQQKAQESAQFGQNPQPTIAQQLQMAAMQGGIMGQLPNNMQMAQQPPAPQGTMGLGDLPVDPNTLPQEGMAGGGLVALAQGGYLDADGSGSYEPIGESYASGGQVYDPTESPWDYVKEAGSRLSNAILPGYDQYREDLEEVEPTSDDELAELENYYATTAPSPAIMRRIEERKGGRNGEVPLSHEGVKNPKAEVHKEAQKVDKDVKKTLRDDAHLAESTLPDVDYGRGVTRMVSQEGARGSEDAAQIQEARDLLQADEAAQGGLPAIQAQQQTATPVENDMMALIDRIKTARGVPAAMSPEERAWRQEQVESANKEKWLQALTAMAGGVFAGGGRNWPEAIGQGALYGLSAYRQGAAAESEAELGLLNRNAQIQEAQRKAQEEAADKLLAIQTKKMELSSASDIAAQRNYIKQMEGALNRESREKNATTMAGIRTESEATDKMVNAIKIVEKLKESFEYNVATPEKKQKMIDEVYRNLGLSSPGLGGGAGIAGGQGIGNRPIMTRRGIMPAQSQSQ